MSAAVARVPQDYAGGYVFFRRPGRPRLVKWPRLSRAAGPSSALAIRTADRPDGGRRATDCEIGSSPNREDADAATEEPGHCDPRHGSGTGAGGGPGAPWRSRWPEEEGQEWAQTAAAKGTGTATGIEDSKG